MKLSILIPYIKRHQHCFQSLAVELSRQAIPYSEEIEILFDNDENDKIGTKRNRLLERATGDYVAFFDADDDPSNEYIKLIMEGLETECDCTSLKGDYSVDGRFDGVFEHSIKYNAWRTTTNEIKYERYPNHLNPIKATIAKQFKFPETNHGEDADWSTQIHKAGLLKNEYYIDDIIYYYNYVTNKI